MKEFVSVDLVDSFVEGSGCSYGSDCGWNEE